MNILEFPNRQSAEAFNKSEARRRGVKVDDPDNITKFWFRFVDAVSGMSGLIIKDKRHLPEGEMGKVKTIAANDQDWFPVL